VASCTILERANKRAKIDKKVSLCFTQVSPALCLPVSLFISRLVASICPLSRHLATAAPPPPPPPLLCCCLGGSRAEPSKFMNIMPPARQSIQFFWSQVLSSFLASSSATSSSSSYLSSAPSSSSPVERRPNRSQERRRTQKCQAQFKKRERKNGALLASKLTPSPPLDVSERRGGLGELHAGRGRPHRRLACRLGTKIEVSRPGHRYGIAVHPRSNVVRAQQMQPRLVEVKREVVPKPPRQE